MCSRSHSFCSLGISRVAWIASIAACSSDPDPRVNIETRMPNVPAAMQAMPATPMPATPMPPAPTSMPPPKSPGPPSRPEDPELAMRTIDYSQALRIAALKLVGDLPTLDEITTAVDAATYGAQIDRYLADRRFPRRMQAYFQDMMKLGGTIDVFTGTDSVRVDLDTAPTFAAELVVEERSMLELFTAETGTCPVLDPAAGLFARQSCNVTSDGVQDAPTAGVLTDPGAMAQFYSNMAFRRVRWIQETFACSRFPAEFSTTPVQKGSGEYLSPWPFDSVSGGADRSAPIDFQDTSAVICANCHTTMNHIAPLFSAYDVRGLLTSAIQVRTPIPSSPISRLSDWLPESGRGFAWRHGRPVSGVVELGQAIASDPAIARCQVARAWNWAMSKLDIVTDQATVPDATIDALVTEFQLDGYKLKPVLKAIFTHDDFVRF